jgi:hypothetical protein
MSRSRPLALFAALLVIGPGCALRPWVPFVGAPAGAYSEADLRADLGEFANRFDARVSAAADAIKQAAPSRDIRKRTLTWKSRAIPIVHETAYIEGPQDALAALMVLMVMLRQYLVDGDGQAALGEGQPVAIEAIDELTDDLLQIARKVARPEAVAETMRDIEDFARQNPIRGDEFNIQRARKAASELERANAFGAIVGAPMAPFRALEGVGSGAAAVHEFNKTAEQFAHIVEVLPRELRWQIELLLYDVEDRDTVMQTLGALESVARSADRTSLAIDRLPGDLRAALGDSQASLAEANRALVSATELMGPLQSTAEQLRLASASWVEILARDDETESTGRPFDVREWESAVRQLAVTAAELRGLTGQLQMLTESQALGTALEDAASVTETRIQALVDRAAWRGAQLILGFFVLLLAYRLLSSRLRRP